jgi:hypothetical protein
MKKGPFLKLKKKKKQKWSPTPQHNYLSILTKPKAPLQNYGKTQSSMV